MTWLLSLGFMLIAAVCYCISQLWCFGKLKWGKHLYGFWGNQSDKRKYLNTKKDEFAKDEFMAMFPLSYYRTAHHKPFKKWYYTTFNIPYTEAFPGSATIFTLFTDGYHCCQFLFKAFICLSIVTYSPILGYWDAIIYFVSFGISFSITYKLAGR